MGGIVFKHNGIVDKYLGDGFLAVFGAPVSRTLDADNAITAVLEMIDSLQEVNDDFIRELGSSITIGISVHTGEVVVGNFGFDMKMDYTVIGDAVNIVFRMQNLTKAKPDSIVISESTSQAVRSKLKLRKIDLKDNRFAQDIPSSLKIYELLGRDNNNE